MLIAIIADTHFSKDQEMTCGCRHTAIAVELLRQAVFQLKQSIQPDLTILLGDLIDDGDGANAGEELKILLEHLRLLDTPFVALPGNHDGDPERFYAVFPRPPVILELANIRFVNNIDAERPGYNAWRSPQSLALLKQARHHWPGQIVSLQHVPVLPPNKSSCPYRYENDQEILQEFRDQCVSLAISAHYHPGVPLFEHENTSFIVAPALCEKPFPMTLIKVNENHISSETLHLLNPRLAPRAPHIT